MAERVAALAIAAADKTKDYDRPRVKRALTGRVKAGQD